MPPKNPLAFLRSVKFLFVGLTSALAVLSSTLIRDSLIPYQLNVIGTISGFMIIVGLIIALVYQSKLNEYIRSFLIICCTSLILLLFFQINYVVTLENYGNPPATYRFIIGCKLTEKGKEWVRDLGTGSSEVAIGNVGYKRIPVMYGTSYYVMAILYSIIYILFVLGIVLTLGGILYQKGNRRRGAPKAKPTDRT